MTSAEQKYILMRVYEDEKFPIKLMIGTKEHVIDRLVYECKDWVQDSDHKLFNEQKCIRYYNDHFHPIEENSYVDGKGLILEYDIDRNCAYKSNNGYLIYKL